MSFTLLARCFAVAFLARGLQSPALAEENLPSPSSVIQRMLQRADASVRAGEDSRYAYEKRSVVEELDKNGKPIETTERAFRVTPIEGVPFSRLIQIQNRELTPEETKAQDRREQEFRRKLARKSSRAVDTQNENKLNEKLLARYEFTVEKRDFLDQRPVIIMSFRPKLPHPAEQGAGDKVLDRLAGKVWVDEADAEVVQVRLGLTEELSLGWFGMVGSLKQCDVEIDRQRLPDGFWVDKRFSVSLGGRKVIAAMRYHSVDELYNYRKF